MNDHFLTYINIERFKCFTHFSASDFKRVNLVTGKNNIGKTAFLEACYLNAGGKKIGYLVTAITVIKISRENLNLILIEKTNMQYLLQNLLSAMREYDVISNLRRQKFQVNDKNAVKEYMVEIDSEKVVINANQLAPFHLPVRLDNCVFIDNFGSSSEDLAVLFQTIQQNDREEELNRLVHEFDPNIEAFKVIGDKPQCKVNGQYLDMTELGSGLSHYIAIICALYACENGHLFIDELGNGIHYTQLDRLWEIILTVSKTTHCQVFAATHSKEMLESFARVTQQLNEQEISYTTLVKNKRQEIKALTLDYELLLDSLEQDHEIR
ncbi:MAG: AAA family ATPase [Thiotrichaceae bacterium]